MFKSLVRAYSTQTHTQTHKVFHKLFKNKINIEPSKLSPHALRTQMALYLINNPNMNHRNHPELLYELQQHHAIQYKKLNNFKENIEKDLQKNFSNDHMLNSMFLLGINYKADELLRTHRRQIKKVDEVKHQSPDFWAFKILEE